jgi:hypothetical protein
LVERVGLGQRRLQLIGDVMVLRSIVMMGCGATTVILRLLSRASTLSRATI